jgi:hypothetical protein
MLEIKLWSTSYAVYVAVSEWGYGIDRCASEAIIKAQEHVPTNAKPSQLLIYTKQCVWEDEEDELVPNGFPPRWGNGEVRLVGLTTTHQVWLRRKK